MQITKVVGELRFQAIQLAENIKTLRATFPDSSGQTLEEDPVATGAKAHADYTREKILRMMGFPETQVTFGSTQWFGYAKSWACSSQQHGICNTFLFEKDGLAVHLHECLGEEHLNQKIHSVHQELVIDDEPFRYYWREEQCECVALTTLPPYPVRFDIAFAFAPGSAVRKLYLNYQCALTDGLEEALMHALQNLDLSDTNMNAYNLKNHISVIVSIVSEQLHLTGGKYKWDASFKVYERLSEVMEQAFRENRIIK